MKLQQDQKYYEKKFAFPSENIPQALKADKEYFLNCANAIVWKFVNNKTALPYQSGESQDSIGVLRSYLYGYNSADKYKNLYVGPPNAQGKRKTTMNISWRVPQILPEKMDVVRGYIMKLAYEISTQAIDMQANTDKDLAVANLKLMLDDRMKLIGVGLNEAAGREVVPPEQGQKVPFQNEQQVDMFAKVGGVLLEQEASIKILLEETIMQSDWDGIKDKLIEDILAAAIAGTKVYTEAGSDVPKVRYVNIDKAIIPYSEYNDHRDATWAGEFRQMTGHEIKTETGMSNKEFLEIARLYSKDEKSSQYMADFYYQAQQGYSSNNFGMNMLDSMVFDVADVCWIGTHTDHVSKLHRPKEGNLMLKKVTEDYEPGRASRKQGVEVEKYSRQCVYKAKLIVGTDVVFDYGPEYNQTYQTDDTGKQKVILPYRFVRTGSSSLVSRCIGFVDDLALATYKKRNALKKLPPPPGVYIEKSAFENLEIGGNKMTPATSMKLFQDEGYLIGDAQNAWGTNTVGRMPITEIPTGIITQLTLFNEEINFNIQQIERVTGINEIFAGNTPHADTGLGVSKLAINATQNAIYPVVRTGETLFEQTMRIAAKAWQVSSLAMDAPGRKPKPHDRALSFIKIGAGTSFNDFMIKIEAGATEEEKMMLMQDIRALQDIRRQAGVGGIRPSDYLMVFEMIKGGNLKQARLVLAQIEEYIQGLDDQKAQQNQQFNIESQTTSNQQTADNKLKEVMTAEQLQTQREAQNIQLQLQADMILQKQKASDDRRNIAIENIYGAKKEKAAK